jgi:hypothetical protein
LRQLGLLDRNDPNVTNDDHHEMDSILAKVVALSTPREIVALVKAVNLARPDVHAIIEAVAQRQRFSGDSPAQALARFITCDPDGIKLYQILNSMRDKESAPARSRSALVDITAAPIRAKLPRMATAKSVSKGPLIEGSLGKFPKPVHGRQSCAQRQVVNSDPIGAQKR